MFPITPSDCAVEPHNGNVSLSTLLNKKATESAGTIERLARLKVLFKENPALEEALQIITELELNRY